MKEKIARLRKNPKFKSILIIVVLGLLVIGCAIAAIVVKFSSDNNEPSNKVHSTDRNTDRVVRGPKTSVLYYNNFEDLERGINDCATVAVDELGKNIIERTNDGTNNYIEMQYNANGNCFYQASCTGADRTGTTIIEISLSTDGKPAEANLQYPYTRSTTTTNYKQTLFNIREDGTIYVTTNFGETVEEEVGKIEQGKWTKIGIKLTAGSGNYSLCIYDEVSKTWNEKVVNVLEPATVDPSFVRLFISKESGNIGRSLLVDEFAVYSSMNFLDISKFEVPKAIEVTTAPDVEMVHPEISDIGNEGIVVMGGKDFAYVGEEKVFLSAETVGLDTSEGDKAEVKEGFFQSIINSIVNFFKKLFGMEVKKATIVKEPDIKVPGDFIKKYLGVEVEKTSELYNLGEIAKENGKNVVYDSRGMLVVTDSDIKLDAEKDVKLLTLLYGLMETDEEISNYAAAPIFTQELIDKAINVYPAPWGELGEGIGPEKSACALYYLTLISRFEPDAKHSTKDITVVDAALTKVRALLAGGGEPYASAGCFWGHAVVASSFTIVKNTDVVYSQLDDEERDRMDTLMEAMAIAANWAYNDANDYGTSFDLQGNLNDSPNFRNTYLSVALNASLYFGEERLNEILVTFDYDKFLAKIEDYGFTNIYRKWTEAGTDNVRDLMENGGEAILQGYTGNYYSTLAGTSSGTGVGVKVPFVYEGHGAGEVLDIFQEYLAAYSYSWATISEYGTPGTATHCYILSDNKISPFEGQMGMMYELASVDSGDIRSRLMYAYDSYEILITMYANMKLFGGWDSSTQRMREIDNRIWVGNEDLLFKMQEGYYGRSIANSYEEYEYDFNRRGHEFIKDIWNNFHCMLHTETTTTVDPNKLPLTEVESAEPKDGDGINPPEGAFTAKLRKSDLTFRKESFYRLIESGKAYESGKIEFEIIMPDNIDEEIYDAVVMLGKEDKNLKWANMNMLIQFKDGWINVYNGAASVLDYKPTQMRFASNYRYKVEMEFDVALKNYTTKITQTWPETDKEISFTADRYKFRATGDQIEGVNSLIIVQSNEASPLWVSDLQFIEKGKIVSVVEPEYDMERIPGAFYQNDFNTESRSVSLNVIVQNRNVHEFVQKWDSTGNGNGWLAMISGGSDNGWFEPKISPKSVNDSIVVEMKISTDGNPADLNVLYKGQASVDSETNWNTLLNIIDGKVQSGGHDVANLSAGKWTKVGIIFTPSTGSYAVYEFNQTKGIYERRIARELRDSVIAPTSLRFFLQANQAKGSNLYFDDIVIYKGTEFYKVDKNDTTGTVVKNKVNIATPEGYYYWSDYNADGCNVIYDALTKSTGGYEYTQGKDANNNGYMNISSKTGSKDSDFFRAQIEGAKDGNYIITEISLRADASGTPKVAFMYDYDRVESSTKVKNLFTVSEESGKVIGGNKLIASLNQNEWTRIGIILNKNTGEYTLYEYDSASKTYMWKASGSTNVKPEEGFPTFVGMSISGVQSESTTRTIHVDDFYVYGSDTASFKGIKAGSQPEFDGVYYDQNYEDADLWMVGYLSKSNGGLSYTRKADANGNAYVHMETNSNADASDYFRAALANTAEDKNRSLVVELSLRAGKDGIPKFSFMFDTDKNITTGVNKTKVAFQSNENAVHVIGASSLLTTLSTETWSRVGMILDLDTGVYNLYGYDESTNTYVWKEEGSSGLQNGYPTYVGFYFPALTDNNTHSMDIDDFRVYSGTGFANAQTGVEPEFDGTYYSQDYNVAEFITMDAMMSSTSGYNYTQGLDADGNGYLKVTSKEDTNATSYFRANIAGAADADSVVLEVKLRAGEAGVPQFYTQFDRVGGTKTMFTVDPLGDRVYMGTNTVGALTTTDWTQIGVILNVKTGKYTVYQCVDGKYVEATKGSTALGEGKGKPTYFGFYILGPGEGNQREFHVDDFKVYEGSAFRDAEIVSCLFRQDFNHEVSLADDGLGFIGNAGDGYSQVVSGQEGYISFGNSSTSGSKALVIPFLNSHTDKTVWVEMDVLVDTAVPYQFYIGAHETSTSTKQMVYLAQIKNGVIAPTYQDDTTVYNKKLNTEKWVKLSYKIDLVNGTYTAYVDGEEVYTGAYTLNTCQQLRLTIMGHSVNNANRKIKIDNFAVYLSDNRETVFK